METKKSFLGLEDAYAFFRRHSNQLGQCAAAITDAVEQHRFAHEEIRICFFGCGDPEIAIQVASSLGRKHTVDMTLVDQHGGWLDEAAGKMRKSGVGKVSASAEIREAPGPFDLIIAYHTLYYVPDLQQALSLMNTRMSRDGILLGVLASRSNRLKQCAVELFAATGQPIPYWQEEDLEGAVAAVGLTRETIAVQSAVSCADTTEARTALINFLMVR